MPRKVLNTSPEFGFFGKLPVTGDFVSRGLRPVFRGHWDAFVSKHLAGRLRAGSPWPNHGLRFRLVSGGQVAAGVIVPGKDSADRVFPLSLMVFGADLPAASVLDIWCDKALLAAGPAGQGMANADELLAALEVVPIPVANNGEKAPGLQFWTKSAGPIDCDPFDPEEAIRVLFSL